MHSDTIKKIQARFILDSRGNPTIEADVMLSDGSIGRAAVPSGASTGKHEAVELRDNNKALYCGKGVYNAISNINNIINPLLLNKSIDEIALIDELMIKEDGTSNKSNLGANAILAVSLACLKAKANYHQLDLYQLINKLYSSSLSMPIPMMNILNGGAHADNPLDIQEFMIFPIGFSNFYDALRAGTEIFHHLKSILKKAQYNTSIGDEGGFAPSVPTNEEALSLIMQAIEVAGYKPEEQIYLALDVAASELYNETNKTYYLPNSLGKIISEDLINYYKELCNKFPIISIEDGLDENDWTGWQQLNNQLGHKTQIVGDDLTVTNHSKLQHAISQNAINAILIKPNQIGTFTETMETIQLAKENNLGVIISHRSGETEDSTIADLAVGCNAGQIKTGSLCRTDRTAKYNQLLRISEISNNKISYATKQTLGCERNK